MKLTAEDVSTVLADVRDNVRISLSKDDDVRQVISAVVHDPTFMPLIAASLETHVEHELPDAMRILLDITTGVTIGYKLGLAEAEKRATGKEQLQRSA